MLDSLLGRFSLIVGLIVGGVGLLIVIATVPDWFAAGLGWWAWPIRALGIASVVVGLVVPGAYAIRWARRRARMRPAQGAPDLDVRPTSGPSPEIRLVVTNQGPRDTFHATARIVAARNDVNPRRDGSYALSWQGAAGNSIVLERLQTGFLAVARFSLLDPQGTLDRMGEAEVTEWNGRHEATWSGFRWVINPQERLPEHDIEVRIMGEHSVLLFRRAYTLTPETFAGPMKLTETPDPS